MLFNLCLCLLIVGVFSQCTSDANHVCINIYNKCPFTVWPGIQGSTIPNGGGFRLNSGESKQISVPNGWKAARIWGRTGCDANFNCETGFCGNSEQCNGRGGQPPVTLAEFTLNGAGGQDFYDVSLVDGYNFPIIIGPIDGTYTTNGGTYDCKWGGGCYQDINQLCPNDDLKVIKNGRTVACYSACMKWNTDEYCCRGSHNQPSTCPRNWVAQIFKGACPTAYSYAYDDQTSTFTCRGNNQPSPAYTVQFC